ncbi:hypothetical protein [Streptomyces chartreusis]
MTLRAPGCRPAEAGKVDPSVVSGGTDTDVAAAAHSGPSGRVAPLPSGT